MMDLPINGSSVALVSSIKNSSAKYEKLPIKTKRTLNMNEFLIEKCEFCATNLKNEEKIVKLPCGHIIHYECIKKWSIISNPCRQCNH